MISAAHPAERWFGASFALLHPQLQALHLNGGRLRGPVQLSFGSGLAGVAGRALARRLGLPQQAGLATLEVNIASDAAGLHWSRRFNDGPVFNSVFQPVGCYPDGHWVERSGRIALRLQVAVLDGVWHWRQGDWFMPKAIASKSVTDGKYVFSVDIRFPLLGSVLAYRGELLPIP